jgi:hypothetical protein
MNLPQENFKKSEKFEKLAGKICILTYLLWWKDAGNDFDIGLDGWIRVFRLYEKLFHKAMPGSRRNSCGDT